MPVADVYVTNHRSGFVTFPPIYPRGLKITEMTSIEPVATIAPGESALIPGEYWAEKKKEPLVAAWLDSGVLTVSPKRVENAPVITDGTKTSAGMDDLVAKVAPHLANEEQPGEAAGMVVKVAKSKVRVEG